MSNVIMVIATVVIAIFSGVSCLVAYRIHQASIQRHKETDQMYHNLVSAIMASGKSFGEPKLAADLFGQQREELSQLFHKNKP